MKNLIEQFQRYINCINPLLYKDDVALLYKIKAYILLLEAQLEGEEDETSVNSTSSLSNNSDLNNGPTNTATINKEKGEGY